MLHCLDSFVNPDGLGCIDMLKKDGKKEESSKILDGMNARLPNVSNKHDMESIIQKIRSCLPIFRKLDGDKSKGSFFADKATVILDQSHIKLTQNLHVPYFQHQLIKFSFPMWLVLADCSNEEISSFIRMLLYLDRFPGGGLKIVDIVLKDLGKSVDFQSLSYDHSNEFRFREILEMVKTIKAQDPSVRRVEYEIEFKEATLVELVKQCQPIMQKMDLQIRLYGNNTDSKLSDITERFLFEMTGK